MASFRFDVLLVICALFMSCGAVTQSFWIKRKLTELINSRYYKSFDVDIKITCFLLCSRLYNWRELYYKSNVCYCLAPNYTPLSETVGNLNIDVGDSIYEMFRDRSDCVSKNYTMFSGTNYCLKMITTPLIWADAENYCKQDGGNMVSVETEEKIANVLVVSQSAYFLVGGYLPIGAANEESAYRWISRRNEPINATFWNIGEPNNMSVEKIVQMYPSGNLNNRKLSYPQPFVCEILTAN